MVKFSRTGIYPRGGWWCFSGYPDNLVRFISIPVQILSKDSSLDAPPLFRNKWVNERNMEAYLDAVYSEGMNRLLIAINIKYGYRNQRLQLRPRRDQLQWFLNTLSRLRPPRHFAPGTCRAIRFDKDKFKYVDNVIKTKKRKKLI